MTGWQRFVLQNVLLAATAVCQVGAQATATVDKAAYSYLGFYAGMPVAELLTLVMRRDQSAFDLDTYCKPAYQPAMVGDRTCYLPSALHRQSGLLLVSVSFGITVNQAPLDYIQLSL